ncbi:MAG: hypothetical protein R3D83_09360 [Caenibius sp.]
MQLRETRQAVTFVSVAREAKVSRQYLYNNFADEIGEERVETRAETEVIDGKKVPLRTPEEYRHIERRSATRSSGLRPNCGMPVPKRPRRTERRNVSAAKPNTGVSSTQLS